jgi:hypothetical protein
VLNCDQRVAAVDGRAGSSNWSSPAPRILAADAFAHLAELLSHRRVVHHLVGLDEDVPQMHLLDDL